MGMNGGGSGPDCAIGWSKWLRDDGVECWKDAASVDEGLNDAGDVTTLAAVDSTGGVGRKCWG